MAKMIFRFLRWSRRNKANAPMTMFILLCIGLAGNTIGYKVFDEANWSDALWYSIISVTTIGYGDFSAASLGARICTVIFIVIIGLGAFTMCIGWLIDVYITYTERRKRGMGNISMMKNHVLIVNFPNEARVSQMLRELMSDAHYKHSEFVIVSNQIEHLPPMDCKNLHFIHGSPLDQNTFKRANIHEASAAVILASNYDRAAESDAYVSSIVLMVETMNPDVRTVAECLDPVHKPIFQATQSDSVVFGIQMATNLLVQEIQDPGVSEVLRVLTSNAEGYTLYSTTIEKAKGLSYTKLAHGLLDADANMISVTRDGQHHTIFGKMISKDNDIVIYTAKKRYNWQELLTMAE